MLGTNVALLYGLLDVCADCARHFNGHVGAIVDDGEGLTEEQARAVLDELIERHEDH